MSMASAHPFSAPGVDSSLQLFEVPVTDVSIVKSKWVDYEPIQSGTNPIEFVIKPLSDYININKTELRLVVKITKRNGGETGAEKKYTLINNALRSIIKQFTIKINETLVTEQSDTQAYNAYIKTLLNFTDQAKKSYLTKALYYKDTAGYMDEVDNTAARNLGLKKRGSFTTGDAEVGMVGGYNTLFSGSGDMNCSHGIDIDREEWEQGYGLFRLDTTPAGSGHSDHLIPNRSGNVNL